MVDVETSAAAKASLDDRVEKCRPLVLLGGRGGEVGASGRERTDIVGMKRWAEGSESK